MKKTVISSGAGKGTKIAHCVCEHEYQDQKYGAKKRVHNPCKKGWRCTVCKREHD